VSTPEIDLIPAAEYARRSGIVKSRMSALFKRGMPYQDGRDEHGRECKFVNPVECDVWRAAHQQIRVQADGAVHGLPDLSQNTQREPAPAEVPPPEHAGGGLGAARAGSEPPKGAKPPPAPRIAARPAHGSGATGAGGGDFAAEMDVAKRIQFAKASEAEDRAYTQRLRRWREEGLLLDREGAIDAHLAFVTQVGTSIDRMPVTEHQVFIALRRVAERMREDLARYAANEADRLDADAPEPEAGDEPAAGAEGRP